jgi:polyphosphate kinase
MEESPVPDLKAPELYINRELSWLEFNSRVLEQSDSVDVPIFERLKFLGIFSSNLDEFFMVRVAGLQAQRSEGVDEVNADGMNPDKELAAVSARAQELVAEEYRIWNERVEPELKEAGIAVVSPKELSDDALATLDKHFARDIYPALTPIAIDPVHPFPHVRNKGLNVGVLLARQGISNRPGYGIVQVPLALPRLIPVDAPGLDRAFVCLEDLILRHLESIFPRMGGRAAYIFRVTRNFDIEVDDDEAEDLLLTMQAELRHRERGDAVRLEISANVPDDTVAWLCDQLSLDTERDVYPVQGPLYLGDLGELASKDALRNYSDEPFSPVYVPPFRDTDEFFAIIREQDVLLHHPYESFEAVVDFVTQAAEDPNVVAIKQTLYRTGGESPLVRALQRAAELGKQVTALVELKARFDEESNIRWARALERSGVNVMYGLVGLKLHAKVLMVVRKSPNGLERFVHLATGNYNQQTARLYEDLSLFTSRPEIAEDATALFNLLTGYSTPESWQHFIVAPLGLHEAVQGLIRRETEHARAGRPAGIIAKMNSLVDADSVRNLYEASQAGVSVDLLVRGICCLRPGVPGVSENIRVYAVIDRFLEHARLFRFENGGQPEVFCSSADWMPRNFRRRIEVMFPVLDKRLRKRVTGILETMRSDNQQAWELRPDGRYIRRRAGGEAPVRSQFVFMEMAREKARESPAIVDSAGNPLSVRARAPGAKKRKKRKPKAN